MSSSTALPDSQDPPLESAPPAPAASSSEGTPSETTPSETTPSATTDRKSGHTRLSGIWASLIVFTLLLVLLLVFIVENGQDVSITFFGLQGSLPLAVAMLVSAAAGILLAALAGTARMLQLRRLNRRGPSAR